MACACRNFLPIWSLPLKYISDDSRLGEWGAQVAQTYVSADAAWCLLCSLFLENVLTRHPAYSLISQISHQPCKEKLQKRNGQLEGNTSWAPLSLPRTFQIDLNKLKNIAYHFVKLLQAKFGIWQWLFQKKKMSQIMLDNLHLLMWIAQLPILHVTYKIKMNVVILLHSIL